jgi:hypothetical protein
LHAFFAAAFSARAALMQAWRSAATALAAHADFALANAAAAAATQPRLVLLQACLQGLAAVAGMAIPSTKSTKGSRHVAPCSTKQARARIASAAPPGRHMQDFRASEWNVAKPRVSWRSALLFSGGVLAASAPASPIRAGELPCPPGRFRPLGDFAGGGTPLATGSPSAAFVLGPDTLALGVCGVTQALLRVRGPHTRIHAVWSACPGFGRATYRGVLFNPSCRPVAGVLRWRDPERPRRRHALKFEALREDPPAGD